jgi:copper chaperone
MSKIKLAVNGMTCEHCVKAVTHALRGVAGVESAEVDLAQGRAVVVGAADVQRLLAAIAAAGYRAEVRG